MSQKNFVSYDDATSIVTEVASKIAEKQDVLSFDNSPTQNSDNPVKSGGVYTALASKANTSDIGTAAAKNFTTSVTNGSNDLVTSGAVYTAIDNLPEPMVFKGSLGTGGTITALPVNGTATVGDTYKVITAGTYASKAAKVGDTFICLTKTSSANTWELIPSGDEPSGTVTSVTLKATSPIAIDSSSAITTSGTRTLSHANSGATAGSYGDSGNQTPGYGSTFKVPYVTINATGHVTAISEHTVKIPASDNTDTKVTSEANHYSPSAVTSSELSANASGATAAWSIDVVKGLKIQRDSKGHVVGVSVTSGKIPANPNTNTTYSLTNNGSSVRLTGSDSTNKDVSLDTLLSNLPAYTATATDDTYFIRRDTGGTAQFGQVKFSTLWSYVKGKADSVYATSSSLGTAAYTNSSNYRKVNSSGEYVCSGNGQNWYYKIATITIGGSYVNGPILFHLGGRGYPQTNLIIRFASISGTDPSLELIMSDNYQGYYIRKTSTSTWEVIGRYNEKWGRADLYYIENYSLNVAINMENIGNDLPSGCTQASKMFPDTTYTASTTSVGSASAGTAIAADDITAWSAGTMTSASYASGVLTITNGSAPSLSYTARSIPNISVSSKTVVTGITAG